jgi:hypothetical protein
MATVTVGQENTIDIQISLPGTYINEVNTSVLKFRAPSPGPPHP